MKKLRLILRLPILIVFLCPVVMVCGTVWLFQPEIGKSMFMDFLSSFLPN